MTNDQNHVTVEVLKGTKRRNNTYTTHMYFEVLIANSDITAKRTRKQRPHGIAKKMASARHAKSTARILKKNKIFTGLLLYDTAVLVYRFVPRSRAKIAHTPMDDLRTQALNHDQNLRPRYASWYKVINRALSIQVLVPARNIFMSQPLNYTVLSAVSLDAG